MKLKSKPGSDRFSLNSAFRWPAIGLTVVGLLLRVVNLGRYSFWFDEAMEILRALTPWPDILLLSEGADPPLLRLLISPIAALTLSEFWLRLPAAVFGAGAIYLAYYWLFSLGHPRLGLITAALLAFAPIQVFYSQEVSQYSLSVLLALALLIAFDKAGRHSRRSDWLVLGLTSAVSLGSYYGLAWLLPALDLRLFRDVWRKREQRGLGCFVGFHAGLAAALAILYRLAFATQYQRFSGRKLSPRIRHLGVLGWLATLSDQLYHRLLRFFTIPWSREAPEIIPVFFGILCIIGSVVLWLRIRRGRSIIFVAFFTLALLCAADGLGVYPFGWRYALFLSPFLYLLIASAIQWLSRWPPVAALTTTIVLSVLLYFSPSVELVSNPWMNPPREDLRPVIDYVGEHAQPADLIYVYYGAKPGYQVYEREESSRVRMGVWFRDWDTQSKIDSISEAVDGASRFWIVLSHVHDQEAKEILHGLTDTYGSYSLLEESHAEGARAFLLSQD